MWTNFAWCEDGAFTLPSSFGDTPAAVFDYNLLDSVTIPLQDPKTQYVDDTSDDGFPAFGFKVGSQIKMSHRLILPEKLTPEFSIAISAKPKSRRGGFIFAVVNTYETVAQLGVRIAPENGSTTSLSLFYTDPAAVVSHSIANFTVPRFSGKWVQFAFRVTVENVTLFFNCSEYETVFVQRKPLELEFDSASILYVAQAGPALGDPFEWPEHVVTENQRTFPVALSGTPALKLVGVSAGFFSSIPCNLGRLYPNLAESPTDVLLEMLKLERF